MNINFQRLLASACAVSLFLAVTGCTTLGEVRSELHKGGFDMLYPAESGVEAGQIWAIQRNQKTQGYDRPANVEQRESTLKFTTLTKNVDASVVLNADFAPGVIGKAGELEASLSAGTVKKVTLDFGATKAYRIKFGDLTDPMKVRDFPANYRLGLAKAKAQQDGHIVIAAVVYTSGMTYNLEITNKADFEAKAAGEIKKLLGAGVTFNYKSDKKVELVIPDGQSLAIGLAPLDPKLLQEGFAPPSDQASDADLIKTISAPITRL